MYVLILKGFQLVSLLDQVPLLYVEAFHQLQSAFVRSAKTSNNNNNNNINNDADDDDDNNDENASKDNNELVMFVYCVCNSVSPCAIQYTGDVGDDKILRYVAARLRSSTLSRSPSTDCCFALDIFSS